MKKPVSVQLYSLRDDSAKDFRKVLEFVAQTGFKGVEPAGLYGMTPREFKRVVEDLGMVISSTHGPCWAKEDNLSEVIDIAGELGIDMVCCGYGKEEFRDIDSIKKTADSVNGMIETLKKAKLGLFQHNHYWEFDTLDGTIKYDIYTRLCPAVMLELDAYWAVNFGLHRIQDVVLKYRHRMPLIHIKDGPLVQGLPMTAFGEGRFDIPSAINAADPSVLKWIIVELDEVAGDMKTAIKKSYDYVIANGLAEGNV